MELVAKVAVDRATYRFDQPFDYRIPASLRDAAKPGCRVLVPFGKGGQRQGVLLAVGEPEDGTLSLKSLVQVLDPQPLLSEEMIRLVYWLKERYFCTLFEAVKLLLPGGLYWKVQPSYSLAGPLVEESGLPDAGKQVIQYLQGKEKPVGAEKICRDLGLDPKSGLLEQLCTQGILRKDIQAVRGIGDAACRMVSLTGQAKAGEPDRLTPRQKEVYRVLRDVGIASVKETCYFAGVTPAVVQGMVKRGILQITQQEVYRSPYSPPQELPQEEPLHLSPDQQEAFDTLRDAYDAHTGRTALLYGVTGSGKTWVFFRLIDFVLQQGEGVILMVPEISLTPQMVARFHRRYGRRVAVFHSGLSAGERLDEWKRVQRGEACIAIGTRSAVFAPFARLGLVILDEEQESSYKSEASPRFHAREVARFRCAYHKGLLLLASATPSVETFYAARQGKYTLAQLPCRYGQAQLPEVVIADLNREIPPGDPSVFGQSLARALAENLQAGRQSILLLNRRGYHTFVSCRACGEVLVCPSCSISLTYHAANRRLMCHYCGYSAPFTDECPHCHEHRVRYTGLGTQRAEEQLREMFPQARVLRMDADSTMSRFSYEKHLGAFAAGEYDILLGTQMVAKGLDFASVTLVGVLSADQMLYGDTFRSSERAFDLITQVVGRSGRGRLAGRAILQTFTPENPVLALAARQDYLSFYEGEIPFRKAMLYPPFADLVAVGFTGGHEEGVRQASHAFLWLLRDVAQREYPDLPLRVLQPSPALIAKISNKYRYRLLIKCRNTKRFRQMLSQLLKGFAEKREYSRITVWVDTSPEM